MFKNIFYRSCALVSEVEDTLRHLYRWHRSWSTPPRDRVLDMYALEDRVLFSISPILKAAALQAGAGGTGAATVHNPQTSAMPALNHALHAAGRGPAAQAARQALDASHNADNGSITAAWAHVRARHDTRHPHAAGNSDNRSVNFVIIDDSLQNLDQLIRSLNPNSEVLLYDHLTESPSEVLNRVSNWAQSHHAQIDTLSILSHGVNGSFVLGNQWLSTSNLADSAPAWQRLGAVMAAGGSIDIFGCNVAAGSNGQNLINDIGRLSGTTVFASVDNTGRGGNWVLEAASTPGTSASGPASGQTTADASAWQNPLNAAMLQQWDGLLTSILVTNANDSGAGSLRQAILDANANPGMDYITFAIPGSGVHTIALNSALPNITDTVSIDGYTQSGASPNTLTVGDNAVLEIELRGASAGSAANGLVLDAGSSGSVIKGLDIEGFAQTGIYILSSNNIISGDFIGTNAAGSAALGNSYGVYALNGQYNTIGGTTAAARNLISGNATEGVYIDSANFTTVTGNYIGTNAAGSGAIANNIGIYSYNASYTTIGGVAVGAGNVISGNSNCGIHMDWGLTGNVIQGNYIGTNASATAAVPNATGVMANHTTGLTIGGTAAGTGNVISGNSGDGVKIADDSPDNPSTVRVQGNSIYSNGGLGIDLGGDGVTANDAGDVDTGPNYLQNFPVLTSATAGSGQLTVQGTFNSTANSNFCIDIYTNTAADPTGYGEGQRYIGSFNVTTDGSGNASFTQALSASVAAGDKISATATNLLTDATSEFSQCVTATAPGISVTPTSGLATTEAGGQATFNVVLTTAPSANVTVNLSSSNTAEGTVSASSLTFTPANWNVAQTVTITGVNDNLVDGNIAYTIITAPATSTDPNYNGVNAPDVSVTNIDNGYNTIWVTNNSDIVSSDADTSSVAALYAHPGADGISLREAILAADNTPNGPGGPDHIYFNIPGSGVHTIALVSALPNITDAAIIDGYTQSGASVNTLALGENAALMIELGGASAGAGANGLTIASGSSGSTIRGLAIERFSGSGINVSSDNNIIAGNFIGTNAAGTGVLGNNSGIYVSGSGNMIGGTTADARNLICNSSGTGVVVFGASATGDSIMGNDIYSNGGLGIDLGNDGVTPNHTGDAAGPNNLQNFPVLTSAVEYNNQFTVQGSFSGAPNTTYRIAVFANTTVPADPSGYGEGQRYLGSFSVTTDGSGNASFNQLLTNASVTAGEMISATATRLTAGGQPSDTSEFSQCVKAAIPGITVTPLTALDSSGRLLTTENGGQAQFSVVLSTQPTTDVTITLVEKTSTGDLTPNRGTLSTTTLTFTSSNWNVPQIVTVTGINDWYIEPATGRYSSAYNITASVTSTGDAIYNSTNANVAPQTVSMWNTDNDTYNIIWVNTTQDAASGLYNDGDTSSIAALYNSPGSDGCISLREAINASNTYATNAPSGGVDNRNRIYFDIPQSMGQLTTYTDGTQAYTYTINVVNVSDGRGLPVINNGYRVIIDGTTEPGYTNKPIIVLDGGAWTNSKKCGFTVSCPDIAIRGLVIDDFTNGVSTANSSTVVQDCYIGTDPTGEIAKPNTTGLYMACANFTVDSCLVSGNTGAGVSVGGTKDGGIIENCYIGVDSTENAKLPNGAQGIYVSSGRTNLTITGNVISGNGTYGIDNAGTSGTVITDNLIGVGANGTTALGNTSAGIWMEGSTSNNTIGGTTAALGNIIAYNGGDGIKVTSTAATGTVIESNNIFSNSGLGINMASGANPPSSPAITSATTNTSSLIRVSGTLASTANRTFRIDFFANSLQDLGGNWEGQVFLGYTTVTTDGAGHASFTTDLSASVALGKMINATTTDLTTHVTSGFGQTVVTAQNVGITVSPTSGLTTKEDGTTAQFSVVLTSAPLFDVTIPIWSDNTAEGVVSTSSLTFTPGNWNVPQIVIVAGVPDNVTDGNKQYHIITDPAVTSDPLYSGLNASDVSLTNIDIDVPGIIVTPASNPLITSENGLAATFNVQLNTRPGADVTIGLSSSNTSEGTVSTPSLTFTPANWNVAQTVTVTGQDDGSTSSSNVAYTIVTAPATSADANYNGIDAADVSVTNIANDAAGISVIPITPLTTTEAGGHAQFVVLLDKQPTADVTISLSSSDTTEGIIDKSSLTFTTSNPAAADYWSKPQTVTVTGVPDNIVDGNIAYTIDFSAAASGDSAYNGMRPASLPLTNIDIDTYNKIYVNTTSDVVDGTTTSIAALYANPGTDGAISLREAILAANNTANATGGPDHIYFDIPGSGVQTITLSSTLGALPNISDAVVIDGYTQPGASANTLATGDNAVLLVEISGANAGTGANGLTLAAGSSGSTIRGLAIDRFSGDAVKVVSNSDAISGNFLGTNVGGGTSGIGNGYGVYVTGANNIIGGASAADRNLISGNTTGIDVYGATATGNIIYGNYIGTNAAGTSALANGTGILADQSTNLTIGGTASGEANLIAFNSGIGVNVSNASIGVQISENLIYSNGGLGIDLGGDGVTQNDTGDADTGANNLQNFPIVTYATILNGNLTVHGSLNSTPNTTYRIEVFANDAADPTGCGEGQVYLGSFNVTTDSAGNANFDNVPNNANVLNVAVTPGKMISATATSLTTKDTSEFARCDSAVAPAIIVTPTSDMTTYKDNHQEATFTVALASAPAANVSIVITSLNTYEGMLVSGTNLVSSITLTFTPTNYGPQTVTVAGVNNGLIESNIVYTVATAAATSSDLNYNGVKADNVSLTNINTNTFNTIWVDTNSDTIDGDTSSLLNLFYNRGADGKISLREAITAANNTPNGPGPDGKGANDCIYFNITPDAANPTDSHTITVASGLPNLTDSVTIDGTTDPHFAGTPIIELDGENAGSTAMGINIRSPYNIIRGLVINRFSRYGIWIINSHNTVVGCYIGTDVTGTIAQPNGWTYETVTNVLCCGIYVSGDYTTIGGSTAADGNVISGNMYAGIVVNSSNNTITGNYVGVDATGNVAMGNTQEGIIIYSTYTGNTIGGTTPGAGNVISGNGTYGIDLAGSNTIVEGNYIGLNATGVNAIGNGSHGIYLESTALNNTIGGTADGAGNIIAYNSGDGVHVADATTDATTGITSTAVGNAILSNQIYSNAGPGIDLGAGANDLQNYPELIGVATSGSQVNIQGTLNSTAGRTFRIEFFANDSADASGYGEGQKYLGYVEVTADNAGNANFLTNLSASVAAGKYISATATDLTSNDTSEFAQNVIAKAPRLVIAAADGLTTSEDGATAQFSVALNAPPISDVTIAVCSSDTARCTVSTSLLTFTPSNWNLPQTVTVTGIMDYVVGGNVPYTINLTRVIGSDAIYNGLGAGAVSLVNIAHVNRPPAVTVPAKQTTSTSLLFSSATDNAIRIEDIDAGPNPLQVQLTATNGQLTLGSTSGLSFIAGSGSGNAAVEVLGTIADINAALDGMRFTPSSSSGNLEITVNDQGYSGSGGPQSATANVAIEVATPKRQSLPPPLFAAAPPAPPSPPSPTPVPPASPIYVNPNFMRSFEQNSHFVRAEATNGNRVIGRGMGNMLLGNAQSARTASVDISADYLSTHDRFQAYAIQPIVTKLSDGSLSLQSIMDTQLLWKEIKEIATQGETLPWLSKINVGTVIGLSAGISAGYIMMAFRWGALITSGLAATFPVWQWIDPLPILESSKNKSDGQKFPEDTDPNAKSPSTESLESLIS